MRVPSSGFTDRIINQLQQLTSRTSQLQNQISTGQRITNPGDDPAAVQRVLNIESEKQQLQQFSSNNNTATSISQSVFSTVSQLKAVSDRAGELATLGSSGTTDATSSTAYAAELNQLIEQSVQTLNTKFNGNYLLGGTKTDTQPFAVARDSSGKISSVSYNGTSAGASFRISESSTISPYTDGTTNQQLGDFVNNLVTLRNALGSNNPTAVHAAQPNLTTSENNLLTTISGIGAVQSTLEADASQNQSHFSALQNLDSQETSTDIAATVVKLTQAQTTYQAALQSTSSMLHTSLLNYIGQGSL